MNDLNANLINEMHQYGRENLAMVNIFIQSPYVTKIRRDVAMTWTNYVANTGGFAMGSNFEIIDPKTALSRTVLTSTGETGVVAPNASVGTLTSGGLY